MLPVLVGLLVSYPLLRFMLLPLVPAFGPEVTPPSGTGPALGEAVATSILLATLAAACAVPPSLWLGTLLERRRWRGRGALVVTLLLLFLMPGYLVAAGWQIVAGVSWLRDGLLGWPGLVGLMALKAVPVATVAVAAGWGAFQPRLNDATRLHVRSRRRRCALAARPIAPAALSAFVIVFVEAMHDYGLASTIGARLHLKLLVTEVYASLAAWPISWTRAALAGDLLILIALAPLTLRLWVGAREPPLLDRSAGATSRPLASRLEAALGYAAIAFLLGAGCGVPLAALAADAFSADAAILPSEAWHALPTSLLYAFSGALAALGLGCATLAARGGSRLRTALAWLPLGNLAVPGIVLAAADIIAFNHPPLALIGTPLALLLALVATQFPVLALLLRSPVQAHSALLGDAARVHGIGLLDRIERIYLPPLLRPLAWAWALAFSRIFFELPLAQMLAPAGGEPVGVVLVQLQQSLRFAAEARLSIAALLVCGGVVGAVLLLAERTR